MLTCDSITKIVIIAFNEADEPFKNLQMEIQDGECDLSIPLTSASKQVAAVLTGFKPRLTVPFPTRPDNDKWTVIPHSTPLRCSNGVEPLVCEAKQRFLPFTANQIIVNVSISEICFNSFSGTKFLVTVRSGQNLKFVDEPKSPRQVKKSERKNAKVEPIVGILFNDLKIRSNVIKRVINPEWNQVFQM